MTILRQSSSVLVMFGPFLDDTDGKTAETALVIVGADVRLSKNGADMVGTTEQGAADSGASHDELGYYQIQLVADDTNTVGRLQVMIHKAGALPVWKDFQVIEEAVYDALYKADATGYNVGKTGYTLTETTGLGNQTANITGTIATVTAVTNGVTLAAGAVSDASLAGNMEIVFETDFATNYNTTRNAWATNTQDFVGATAADPFAGKVVAASVTGAVGSVTGAVGSVTGAVGSVTGAVGSVTGAVASVTGAVGSVAAGGIVAASFADNAITAAKIADAAIDNATFAADVGSTAYATNIIALAVRKVLDELNLDHLMKTAVVSNADMTAEVVDGTVLSNLMSSTSDTSTFAVATDSLEGLASHASHGLDKLVRSTTPANTLDINATGEAGANVLLIDDVAVTPLTGALDANVTHIMDTALTETVAGYLAAAFKKLFDVATPVLTAASVNQTGDSYAIVNHASHGNAQLVRSTTPANTLDVSATGEAGIDWANVGSPTTTVGLSGTTVGTVTANTDMRGTDSAALASEWTATRAGYQDKLQYLPSATAGAAGGVFIAGSNAATTLASLTCTGALTVSDGVIITASTTNRDGISVTGNGTGDGMALNSGGGPPAHGLSISAYSVDGDAMNLHVSGTGVGMRGGIVGNITGNLSGSVGSVTGAVGSVGTGGITDTSLATGAITAAKIASNAITDAKIATGALTAAKFAAAALDDKGNWNVGKTGYTLTATTGLGNQTSTITGNLTGNVTGNVGGNVTGSVGSVAAGGIAAASIAASALNGKGDWNTTTPPTAAENRIEMDASSTQLTALMTRADRVDALIEDSAGDRFTAKSLEQAPTGGGTGTADWTADEKTAFRVILGIPISGSTPETPAAGALFDLKAVADTVNTNLTRSCCLVIGNISTAQAVPEVFTYSGVTATVTGDADGNRTVVFT